MAIVDQHHLRIGQRSSIVIPIISLKTRLCCVGTLSSRIDENESTKKNQIDFSPRTVCRMGGIVYQRTVDVWSTRGVDFKE